MTAEQLIEEGRKLQRPCFFLRPEVSGEVAAIWHECDDEEIEETGFQCWLTVDARFIPNLPKSITGFISVFSNEDDCETGKIEISAKKPKRDGVKLYAHAANVIPPLDAVFSRGSDLVGEWLKANDWSRGERYNNNFRDKITKAYQKIWFKEFPLYSNSDVYAVLGGWHWPGQDNDWHDLIDDQLMVLTIRDSEPWVEAWRMKNGEFKVIQRTT
jgi:hypothetical protein